VVVELIIKKREGKEGGKKEEGKGKERKEEGETDRLPKTYTLKEHNTQQQNILHTKRA
jgi:hypothetical protein